MGEDRGWKESQAINNWSTALCFHLPSLPAALLLLLRTGLPTWKVPNRYLQGQKSEFAMKNRYKSFKA